MPEAQTQHVTTFVLVHGVLCQSWVWAEMASALRAEGHRVEALDLPSSGTEADDLGDLQADVAAVRTALDALGGDAVLVGHSGGGMVLTELADHAAVQHSVYLAAFWPQRGQSAADLLGGAIPLWAAVRDDGAAQVASDPAIVHAALCADVPFSRFVEQIYPRYVLTSLSGVGTPSTAPDAQHESSYVIFEQDQVVPAAAQEAMAASAAHVYRLPSSHSAMLSMPQQLADLLASLDYTTPKSA